MTKTLKTALVLFVLTLSAQGAGQGETTLSGVPVKVSGIITYNFVLQ